MITSKFSSGFAGDGCFPNRLMTIATKVPSQKKLSFIGRRTLANSAADAKWFELRRYVVPVQKVPLISPDRRPIEVPNSNRTMNGLLIKTVLSEGPARQAKPRKMASPEEGNQNERKGISDENDNEIQ